MRCRSVCSLARQCLLALVLPSRRYGHIRLGTHPGIEEFRPLHKQVRCTLSGAMGRVYRSAPLRRPDPPRLPRLAAALAIHPIRHRQQRPEIEPIRQRQPPHAGQESLSIFPSWLFPFPRPGGQATYELHTNRCKIIFVPSNQATTGSYYLIHCLSAPRTGKANHTKLACPPTRQASQFSSAA